MPTSHSTPPPTKRSGCGSALLGALALPVVLLLLLVALSLFPAGRALTGRVGTAWQVLRGETPTILIEGPVEKAAAEAAAEAEAAAQAKAAAQIETLRTESEAATAAAVSAAVEAAAEEARKNGADGLPRLPNEVPSEPTWDPARLFNGVTVATEIQRTPGDIAQRIRNLPESYRARWQVEVTIPKPAVSLEELQASTPLLATLLPQLPKLLESARVSPIWNEMQRRKLHGLGSALTNLSVAPYRHNFFDINTALDLRSPKGRRAFLLQGDMDIVTDGSDGDRVPSIPEEILSSPTYQPTTSYGWPKGNGPENPIIERYRRGNRDAEGEIAQARAGLRANPANARKRELEALIARQEQRKETNSGIIRDLQNRSYLIAEYDPFIVIPTWVIQWDGEDKENMPRIGDYAVVIHGNKVLPAIVGDAGPNQKVGEASLRIAREVDPAVTQRRGAVNDLSITYLVFPHTAERPFGPPDYEKWRTRCGELLAELGGLGEGVELHHWPNTLPPLPPTPGTTIPGTTTTPAGTPASQSATTATPSSAPATSASSTPSTTAPTSRATTGSGNSSR